MSTNTTPQTLVDKIWNRHVIRELSDGRTLLHIDRHFIHDGSNRQAFDSMRRMKRQVRNRNLNFAVVDHIVSTLPGRTGESHIPGRERIHALRDNCREFDIDCSRIGPQVTWGNSPQEAVAIDERLPDPSAIADTARRQALQRAYSYMDLAPGRTLEGVPIDYAFIGSCTNSRLSDLQAAAQVVRGRKVRAGVTALAVPGSMAVKAAAEAAGLDKIFVQAGFEWRNAGCSMCVGSNGDTLPPGKRSISTTNRNFEHRQGPHSRTHLAGPAMVAAAAVSGCITDVRKLRAQE